MIQNYLKIALRNLWKNRLFSSLNVIGMGIGMAAVGLMGLYIIHELSYDRFHANADRVVRVVHYANWPGGNLQLAPTSAPYAAALKNDYPEVEKTVRIHPEGGGIITYKDKKLQLDDIMFADKSVFAIFSYPFLHGDPANALAQPQSIVLTKSLAEKLFGDAAKAARRIRQRHDRRRVQIAVGRQVKGLDRQPQRERARRSAHRLHLHGSRQPDPAALQRLTRVIHGGAGLGMAALFDPPF